MITFKQFLGEKAMNKRVFASAIERLGDAKLGFELEMWVNENSDFLIVKDEDYTGDFQKTAVEAKKSLEDYLGVDVVIGETETEWKIVPDGSVQGSDNGIGIEIVSPPLPVEDGLGDLQACFKWMSKNGMETNSSTGIHLNLSIPGLKAKLDPLKMILFMGEDHVLKNYAREANSFASKHYVDLINSIRNVGHLPKEAKQLQVLATTMLQQAKYRTVNLSKLDQGYLEFRTGGNDDYHKKYKQIESDVGRFLTILELACDPDAEKQEYMKKLAKLFAAGTDAKSLKPGTYDLAKPGSLENIIGVASLNRLKTRLQTDSAAGIRGVLIHIMDSTGALIKSGRIDDISVKAIAEFKVLFSKAKKLNPDMLQDIRAVEDSEDINAFIKAFNLK